MVFNKNNTRDLQFSTVTIEILRLKGRNTNITFKPFASTCTSTRYKC